MADENEPVKIEGPVRDTRGAQVHLTGEAVVAARGGYGDSIETNTIVRDALIADGTVASGLTTDGKTDTGAPAADPVVTVEGKPGGEVPAEVGTTRVVVEEPKAPEVAKPAPEPPKPVPKTAKGR